MAKNANLHNAKSAKNDEFYTQLTDIAKELMHYKLHFKNKVVYCNCDDPRKSKFWEYFHLNFAELGLKRLVATFYEVENPVFKMEYEGGDDNDITKGTMVPLQGNGDFRNKECLDILDESDIVVTNPPFSLFREFVATLMEHHKGFVIVGNKNAITYKEIFPLLKNDDAWLGYGSLAAFDTPQGTTMKINGLSRWFTNLDIDKRHEKLILYKQYNSDEYPMYDNYNAWNVDKVADIPINTHFALVVDEERYKSLSATYGNGCELIETLQETTPEGTTRALYRVKVENPVLGVPITFLDKYNPAQFEIIAFRKGEDGQDLVYTKAQERVQPYFRILIRRKLQRG